MAASMESMNAPAKPEEPSASGSSTGGSEEKPTCIIVLGMAGSGKTTFVQVEHLSVAQNDETEYG